MLVAKQHLQFGWWALLAFLTLGIVLESLHAFKVGWYLDVGNETRRLMWTLAHAHGSLLAIVNVVFAVTLQLVPEWKSVSRTTASRCLMASSVAIPGGFFLGGCRIYAGDPGVGILLVPAGAFLLFTAVFLTARAINHLHVATDAENS